MFELYRFSTDLDYKELNGCAEYAFQVIFSTWDAKDFSELFASLKQYPSLQKYIEFESQHLRPYLYSWIALPTKERRQLEKTFSQRFRLELTYAHWRMATISLILQNRLLELKTVRTASARKTIGISLNFLSDIEFLYQYSPIWILQLGETSPFLNESGDEVWYPDD